jgi:hypothetical protein
MPRMIASASRISSGIAYLSFGAEPGGANSSTVSRIRRSAAQSSRIFVGGRAVAIGTVKGMPPYNGQRCGSYRAHAFVSQRSLALASAIVCHCMFQTASGPPQASALM